MVCKLCHTQVIYTGNTTNLRAHLKCHHPDKVKADEPKSCGMTQSKVYKKPGTCLKATLDTTWQNIEERPLLIGVSQKKMHPKPVHPWNHSSCSDFARRSLVGWDEWERCIASFFRQTTTANQRLKEKQRPLRLPQHKLMMDMVTRLLFNCLFCFITNLFIPFLTENKRQEVYY